MAGGSTGAANSGGVFGSIDASAGVGIQFDNIIIDADATSQKKSSITGAYQVGVLVGFA